MQIIKTNYKIAQNMKIQTKKLLNKNQHKQQENKLDKIITRCMIKTNEIANNIFHSPHII